jgi:hypothetical protein
MFKPGIVHLPDIFVQKVARLVNRHALVCMTAWFKSSVSNSRWDSVVVVSALLAKTPWPESASELYRPSDRCLSAKLVPTFADRGYRVVSTTDPYVRNLGYSMPEPLFFLSSSSTIVLSRLSGPRSRPTGSQKKRRYVGSETGWLGLSHWYVQNASSDLFKNDKISRTCSKHWGEEECM